MKCFYFLSIYFLSIYLFLFSLQKLIFLMPILMTVIKCVLLTYFSKQRELNSNSNNPPRWIYPPNPSKYINNPGKLYFCRSKQFQVYLWICSVNPNSIYQIKTEQNLLKEKVKLSPLRHFVCVVCVLKDLPE